MKYAVNDWVMCKVENFSNKKRKLCLASPKKDSTIEILSFLIVAIDKNMETYKLIIDHDMIGWEINQFHIKRQNVDPKHLGKRFYDVIDDFVIIGPGRERMI
jgi:hypothetical protein